MIIGLCDEGKCNRNFGDALGNQLSCWNSIESKFEKDVIYSLDFSLGMVDNGQSMIKT